MATPKTNDIAFSNLNTDILQATSTAQCSLQAAGARMGYTSDISLSNLRGCFGGTLTLGTAAATKFLPKVDGYALSPYFIGSVDDSTYTSGGRITGVYEASDSGSTDFTFDDGAGGSPPAGYQGTNVDRACLGDTSLTLGASSATSKSTTYSMGTTGTLTFGIRFA